MRKIFKKGLVVFVSLPFSFLILALGQQISSEKVLASSFASLVFQDSFERDTVFDGNWELHSSTQDRSNFTTTTEYKLTGSRSLKIRNPGSGMQGIFHLMNSDVRGIVSVAFYEYGDNRSAGSSVGVSSRDGSQYVNFQIDQDAQNFVYRINERKIDSGVRRTQGWHILRFAVTDQGTYGEIDNTSLRSLGINSQLTRIAKLGLSRGWGIQGNTYFDEIRILEGSGEDIYQGILDYWSDEVYRIYKDIDLQGVIDGITQRSHLSAGAARSLAGQVMMHLYYHYRDGNEEDFSKAKTYLAAILDKYPYWKNIWLSSVAMNQVAFDFWWYWDKFEPDLRSRFLETLAEEADFWTWVLNEVKNNPRGFTIPEEAGRRKDQPNLSLITTDPDSNGHLYDSRAEENSANAQLLATAYSIWPTHPHASAWNEAAKTFAFHALSKGETYNGITSRTISDDDTLGNHDLWPNPLYTLGSITALQQGQFSYLLAGLEPPWEFFHHIEEKTNSGVWRRNITQCMNSNTFEITEECHAGQDWGDRNLRVASFILGYWAGLQNDYPAKNLMEKMLYYFYSINAPIKYPHQNPVARIDRYTQEGESLQWWRNLEHHPQVSAKIFAVNNYQNPSFRSSFFPQRLNICEENFFHKKIWEGGLNWSCDNSVKKVGNFSVKLSNSNPANSEVFSSLIKVEPNKTYKVSYWVKTDGLQAEDSQVYGKIVAAQYNQNAKEEEGVEQNRIDAGFSLGENVGGTTDWLKKEYIFTTTPQTAFVRLRAPLGLQGKARGTVWYDEVKIEPTTSSSNQLSFKIKFQGINNAAPSKNVLVILKQGGVEKYRFAEVNVNADSSGVYSGLVENIAPGTYDILIKGPVHLQKKFPNVTLNQGANTKDFSLIPLKAGDFNNDNVLNINDIGSLLSYYTALSSPVNSQNQKFDIDASGVININDISLVLANYTALEVRGDE